MRTLLDLTVESAAGVAYGGHVPGPHLGLSLPHPAHGVEAVESKYPASVSAPELASTPVAPPRAPRLTTEGFRLSTDPQTT
jgi:hypothetical protein